jgi:hypothetical protein
MLVTVTNATSRTINTPAAISLGTGVSGGTATGGSKTDPLPYPFGHIGPLASSGSKQLPMHPADWRYKSVPWLPMEPSTEWNMLVQAGIVTLAIASETGRRDSEELFVTAV